MRFVNRNGIVRFYFVFSFLMMAMSSCKNDADIALTPEMSFVDDVKPIINSNCTQSGCHGAVNYEEFQLLTYNDVLIHSKAGHDATNSHIYLAIVGKKEDIMPPSPNTPLDETQIKKILLWMKQGAKNN